MQLCLSLTWRNKFSTAMPIPSPFSTTSGTSRAYYSVIHASGATNATHQVPTAARSITTNSCTSEASSQPATTKTTKPNVNTDPTVSNASSNVKSSTQSSTKPALRSTTFTTSVTGAKMTPSGMSIPDVKMRLG